MILHVLQADQVQVLGLDQVQDQEVDRVQVDQHSQVLLAAQVYQVLILDQEVDQEVEMDKEKEKVKEKEIIVLDSEEVIEKEKSEEDNLPEKF